MASGALPLGNSNSNSKAKALPGHQRRHDVAIAFAIGAMVDAAVVLIENADKKPASWPQAHPGRELLGAER